MHISRKINTSHGVKIYTEAFGQQGSRPLILLHGAGNCMMFWDEELVNSLVEKDFYVVRMDSRDAGKSDYFPIGKPGYGLLDMVGDVNAVADAYGFNKLALAGVSQGSAVAQLLSINYPDRLTNLILISSSPGGPGHENKDLPPMTPEIAGIFATEDPIEPDWNDEEAVITYLADAERPFGGTAFDAKLTKRMATNTVHHATNLRAQLTNPFMVDPGSPWRKLLSKISSPTLVVHGKEDPLFPIEHAKALVREIPDAILLELPGVGHANIPSSCWRELVESITHNS